MGGFQGLRNQQRRRVGRNTPIVRLRFQRSDAVAAVLQILAGPRQFPFLMARRREQRIAFAKGELIAVAKKVCCGTPDLGRSKSSAGSSCRRRRKTAGLDYSRPSLGITGKRALWRDLAAAATSGDKSSALDFPLLEQRATAQFERVEAKCLELAPAVLHRSD